LQGHAGLVARKHVPLNSLMAQSDQAQEKHSAPAGDVRQTIKTLRASTPIALADLMSIWRSHRAEQWSRSPEVYQLLGERILKQGEPLLAYDVINQGLATRPADVRLRQLQGLALARSGATDRAGRVLEQLRDENHANEETLGMLARTYKDRAAAAQDRHTAGKLLRLAAETYAQAHKLSGGYWTGINAATTALLIGKKDHAAKLAAAVRASCLAELKQVRGDKYWLFATLGEAALILRDLPQARDWYAQAGDLGRRRFGDLQSSRRNARLLLDYWKIESPEIERALQIPRIIVFAGHMIDQPARTAPRFPPRLEPAVAREIEKQIEAIGAGLGYASAACGSDILFLEAMLERGDEIVVVLPYEREEFIRDSVDLVPRSNWPERFDRVLEKASRVVMASPQRLEIGGVSYDYTNQLLLGLASIRAHQLNTELIPLAVWDRAPGDGAGGTADVIEQWSDAGLPVRIIDVLQLQRQSAAGGQTKTSRKRAKPKSRRTQGSDNFHSRVMSMLFADAVAFSKLTEQQVPLFVRHFLGGIGNLVAKTARTVIEKNTWGDGIYLVFSDVEAAGRLALDICDLVTTVKWDRHGLPKALNLRIGLHAGPVYEFTDPITNRISHSGTHVSRAARIEPITPAGQVYASEAFAALAAARRVRGFTCDYAGQTPMAKGYGTFPTYHVRRI
jgi:class 3 adenylate cyclase/tetratricopeptide (TPR) repeat protein